MCYDLKNLYDSIKYSCFYKNEKQFKVFTYEASLGKTTTICDALKELYKNHPEIHTLFVTKLKEEQEIIVKQRLGDMAKIINSDNKINEEMLYNYPILVITHERYKILCKNINIRNLYIKDRHNLIIDEQLDLMDVREYNQIKANEIRNLLSQLTYVESTEYYNAENNRVIQMCDLPNYWGNIIKELNYNISDNYQKGKMQFVLSENEQILEGIDSLINKIEKSQFPKSFNNCDIKWTMSNAIKYKETIKNYIEGIKYFFNNPNIIAQNGSVFAYNSKLKYFTLKNNIMLDASGKFLELYKMSDLFNVMDSERVISHKNTTLTFLENNSTTNFILTNEEYYLKVSEYITLNIKENDKVLIIGRAKDESLECLGKYLKFNKGEIEFVNFDAMRGKNDWSDFNKCFIVHTPNRLFQYYPLQYLYYSDYYGEGAILKTEDLQIINRSTNMGFKNDTLENLRLTDVVSSIYQGLKRVNRNNDKECNYYVIVKDKRIQDLLIEQFKDLKEVKYDKLVFSKEIRKEYNATKRNANSIKTQIIEWVDNVWDGSLIKTKDMLNQIGITQKQFDKSKDKDKELQNYLNQLSIKRGYYQKLVA